MPIRRRHSAGVKYVREVIKRGAGFARKETGLPASFIRNIAKGKVSKVSHSAYKKFRNAYDREYYNILRSHNVSSRVARKARGRMSRDGLSFDEADFAASMTDFGRTLEHAVNDTLNWKEDVQAGKVDFEEIIDDIEDMEESYGDMAEVLVVNNGLFEQWKGKKKFINRPGRIRTKADAIAHMQEIMALGFRDERGWDEYISTRHNIEGWRPVEFVKDRKSGRTERTFIEDTGNPKYVDWQRRLSTGRIIKP